MLRTSGAGFTRKMCLPHWHRLLNIYLSVVIVAADIPRDALRPSEVFQHLGRRTGGGRLGGGRRGAPEAQDKGEVTKDLEIGLPVKEIRRLKFPDELTPEKFDQEFVQASEPVIIEGLVDSWLATRRNFFPFWNVWNQSRMEAVDQLIEVNYDAVDARMYRFDESDSTILLTPGRLCIPVWAFLEVGHIRQCILEIGKPAREINLADYPELREHLKWEVKIQNVPLTFDPSLPYSIAPFTCYMRDLVPFAFYYAGDFHALPDGLKYQIQHQAPKLMPSWGEPVRSCCWITSGGPWKAPRKASKQIGEGGEASETRHEKASDWVPAPGDESRIFSCFHFDRWENLHSLLSGEKDVFLVHPEAGKVLRGTRHAYHKQWLALPVPSSDGKGLNYVESTLLNATGVVECFSDQSPVTPVRAFAEFNKNYTQGEWPEHVDYPVRVGRVRKGDTLYIPAYHWHFVATHSPLGMGRSKEEGDFAVSVNNWWPPIHKLHWHRNWTKQNEILSRFYTRIGDPQALLSSLNETDFDNMDPNKGVAPLKPDNQNFKSLVDMQALLKTMIPPQKGDGNTGGEEKSEGKGNLENLQKLVAQFPSLGQLLKQAPPQQKSGNPPEQAKVLNLPNFSFHGVSIAAAVLIGLFACGGVAFAVPRFRHQAFTGVAEPLLAV